MGAGRSLKTECRPRWSMMRKVWDSVAHFQEGRGSATRRFIRWCGSFRGARGLLTAPWLDRTKGHGWGGKNWLGCETVDVEKPPCVVVYTVTCTENECLGVIIFSNPIFSQTTVWTAGTEFFVWKKCWSRYIIIRSTTCFLERTCMDSLSMKSSETSSAHRGVCCS